MVLPGITWEISLNDLRVQVQSTAVEEDIGFEAITASIAVGLFDQALDPVVDPFRGGVG